MSVRARIALLVQAQGAKKAASDVDGVGRATDRLERKTRGAGRSMRDSQRDTAGFHRELRQLRRGLAVGAIAAAGFGAAIGSHAVSEYREAVKVGRQTNAVIKSTGGAAKVSAKDVGSLAESISFKTGIDDEQIQAGQNLLLTFTRIRNEVGKGNNVFDQATRSAVDLAAGMHTDLKSASLQLGKALNDPVRGITALQRAGVQFSGAQRDQIKQWVEQGDAIKAQKLVLREINKEFAGSALAQADPFKRAGNAVNQLSEKLGFALGPTIAKAAEAAAKFITQMTEGTGAGGQFVRVLGVAGAAVKDVAGYAISAGRFVGELVQDFRSGQPAAVALGVALTGLVTGFAAFKILTGVVAGFKALRGAILGVNLVMMANPVVAVIAALIGLGAAMYVAYQKVEWFRNGVNAVFGFIKQYWPVMLGVITGGIGPAVVYVIRNWDRIVSFVKGMPGKIGKAASGMWNGIKDAFRSALNWIIEKWNGFEIGFGPVKIPGPVPDIPKMAIGTPDIPMLAKGGNVSGTGRVITGDAGMEAVDLLPGGGVKVTPLENVPGGRGGGKTLHLTVPVSIDGKRVGTAVRSVALRDLLAEAVA